MDTEHIADLYNRYRFALLVLRGLADDISPDGERAFQKQAGEVSRIKDELWCAENAPDGV